LKASDVAEIAIGACIMAFPVAVAEEVWDLGQELTLLRAAGFGVASVIFLALLVYGLYHHGEPPEKKLEHFVARVLTTYGLTLLISALLLLGIDRLELFSDPLVALKRTILVAFPASFAGTAVDSLRG
jgi:uncharacterized membrane protein